jgi:hypothetical protein
MSALRVADAGAACQTEMPSLNARRAVFKSSLMPLSSMSLSAPVAF